jgi:hypothetical protein
MNYPALLIDSSTRQLIFARIEQGKGGWITAKSSMEQGENAIDLAVAELFPDPREIAEIWLGQGPGSFVGLRSSFAYVRMLAMLSRIPCRIFLSSRLWRSFFGVAPEDWFLTRTNAKLYYAERYTPEREAQAVDTAGARELTGEKFCLEDSWIPSAGKETSTEENPPWKSLRFSSANLSTELLTPEILCLTEPQEHAALAPLYGHELNFALAASRPPAKNT